MKIPLEVYSFAGGVRAMAHFFLKIEELNIFSNIRAIVDTGSPSTIIGLDDRKRMRVSNIKLNEIKNRKDPLALGGSLVEAKEISEADLISNKFKIKMPIILAVKQINENKAPQPSILGVDFLEKNNYGFTFNPNKREAFLEKEE